MKTSTAIAATAIAIVIFTAGLFVEAWILGIILSWFGVFLTFGQNFLIILLANAIFKNSGSSK